VICFLVNGKGDCSISGEKKEKKRKDSSVRLGWEDIAGARNLRGERRDSVEKKPTEGTAEGEEEFISSSGHSAREGIAVIA